LRRSRCDASRRRRRARHSLGPSAPRHARIPALTAEVESASLVLNTPAARLIARGEERLLLPEEVEALKASKALVVDVSRHVVRDPSTGSRSHGVRCCSRSPALGEEWPADLPGDMLVAPAFGAKLADALHRARLRVEVGRLRAVLRTLAGVSATKRGFALMPRRAREVVVLARPVEEQHAAVLAFLADGEAWSSSGPGACTWRQPAHRAAGTRPACGSRQGAVVWSRASTSLDDPAGVGIHDDVVTPRATARVTRMEA
jgi:hypothetical protein